MNEWYRTGMNSDDIYYVRNWKPRSSDSPSRTAYALTNSSCLCHNCSVCKRTVRQTTTLVRCANDKRTVRQTTTLVRCANDKRTVRQTTTLVRCANVQPNDRTTAARACTDGSCLQLLQQLCWTAAHKGSKNQFCFFPRISVNCTNWKKPL